MFSVANGSMFFVFPPATLRVLAVNASDVK